MTPIQKNQLDGFEYKMKYQMGDNEKVVKLVSLSPVDCLIVNNLFHLY